MRRTLLALATLTAISWWFTRREYVDPTHNQADILRRLRALGVR
jgi:hypothetical protein